MNIGSKNVGAVVAVAVIAGILAAVGPSDTARAQSRSVQALADRLGQLERRLVDLERQVYRGGGTPRPSASAPSTAPTRAADVEVRLMQLEEQIRGLTGNVEESDHRARQVSDRFQQLVGDVDVRLKELEASIAEIKGGGATVGAIGEAAPASTNVAAVPTAPAGAPQALVPAPPATATLPVGPPIEQYKYATGLVRQKAFADAEQAFRAFLDRHPDDQLAPNAQYWLGETLYVREKYEDAARVFLAGYQRYPDSAKASDSLLKLGVTLNHLGQRDEACATFRELLGRLPKNERRLRPKAELERRNANCS